MRVTRDLILTLDTDILIPRVCKSSIVISFKPYSENCYREHCYSCYVTYYYLVYVNISCVFHFSVIKYWIRSNFIISCTSRNNDCSKKTASHYLSSQQNGIPSWGKGKRHGLWHSVGLIFGEMSGENFRGKCPKGKRTGGCPGECLDHHAGLQVCRIAVMICDTLVNTQTHTDGPLLTGYSRSSDSWANNIIYCTFYRAAWNSSAD